MRKIVLAAVVAALPTWVAAQQSGQPTKHPPKSTKLHPVSRNPCAQYGVGFARIPGSDTCVKIGGSVSVEGHDEMSALPPKADIRGPGPGVPVPSLMPVMGHADVTRTSLRQCPSRVLEAAQATLCLRIRSARRHAPCDEILDLIH